MMSLLNGIRILESLEALLGGAPHAGASAHREHVTLALIHLRSELAEPRRAGAEDLRAALDDGALAIMQALPEGELRSQFGVIYLAARGQLHDLVQGGGG